MRLGTTLLLGFLIVLSLVFISGYYSMDIMFTGALEKSVGESSVRFAEEALGKIDESISLRVKQANAFSQDSALLEAVIKSNYIYDNVKNMEELILYQNQKWQYAKDTTPFINGILGNDLSNWLRVHIEAVSKRFSHNVFPAMYVTNKYGVLVAATEKTKYYDVSKEDWYQVALEKENFVGNVFYYPGTDSLAMQIGIKLYDSSGNFAGMLICVMNLQEQIESARQITLIPGIMQSSRITLLNANGQAIFSTENLKLFDDYYTDTISRFVEMKTPGFIGYFLEAQKGDLFAVSQSNGFGNFDGGWYLLIKHESGDVFKPVRDLEMVFLGSIMIIALIAVGITFFVSRMFLKPLKNLKDYADKISKGFFNEPIEVRGMAEVSELAASLDSMRYSLKMVIGEYEKMKGKTELIEKAGMDMPHRKKQAKNKGA